MPALSRRVEALPRTGSFSVWAGPTTGDAWLTAEPDLPHYAASTMKLALVMAAYREAELGRLDLDEVVTVHNEHRSALDGRPYSIDRAEDSDPEPWTRLGTPVALRWLAYRAIVRSSNLATNLLLDAVGTSPVEVLLRDAGATGSVVCRGIEDHRARDAGFHNVVTARDLSAQLQALVSASLLSRSGSAEILAVLAAQQVNDAIPARLPPGTRVAHKSGWMPGVSHDAGIVDAGDGSPFIFVMCTTSPLDEHAALGLIADAAAAAYADRRARA